MGAFGLNLLLAAVWAALSGRAGGADLAMGFAVGFVAIAAAGARAYPRRAYRALRFAALYLGDLARSAVRVAHDVVTPRALLHPGIIAIPLDARTDAEIAVTAHLITLTPGTLSLDVSSCRRWLYVHGLFADRADVDRVRRGLIDDTQAQVLRLLRSPEDSQ